MGEMGEDGWNGGAGCRGELTAAGEKCRGEVQAAGPWAAACRTDHVAAGQRGFCRGEAAGPWGSCRAEMVAGPRSHAMVESGLEPSDAYEDGVEFTEVSDLSAFSTSKQRQILADSKHSCCANMLSH